MNVSKSRFGQWVVTGLSILICVGILPGSQGPFFDLKTVSLWCLAAFLLLTSSCYDPRVAIWSAVFSVSYGFTQIWNHQPFINKDLIDWISFFVILGAVSSGSWQKGDVVRGRLSKLLLLTVGMSLVVFCIQILNRFPYPYSFYSSSNLYAEFLGISLVIFATAPASKSKWLTGFISASSLGVIVYLHCRGVLLALLVLSFQSLFQSRSRIKKKRQKILILIVLVGIVIALGRGWGASSQILSFKKSSTSQRYARFFNTFYLMKDHPFGVGADQYQVQYPRYKNAALPDTEANEFLIKSPHNIFQECGATYGIQGLILAALVIFSWWISAGKEMEKCGILYFLIEGATQFPMGAPQSFFLIAIFLGLGLNESKNRPFVCSPFYAGAIRLAQVPLGLFLVQSIRWYLALRSSY